MTRQEAKERIYKVFSEVIRYTIQEYLQKVADNAGSKTPEGYALPTYRSGPYVGSPYFSKPGLSSKLEDAMFAVANMPITVNFTGGNNLNVKILDLRVLDSMTPGHSLKQGVGYWRLFDGGFEPYKSYGRMGGSNKARFYPGAGNGVLGEGAMKEGTGFKHPGVQPAHMLSASLKLYKPWFNRRLKKNVNNKKVDVKIEEIFAEYFRSNAK